LFLVISEGEVGDRLVFNRDKVCLAILWLRDESLEESANLSNPDIRAQEIVEDLDLSEYRDDLA
jgi:hypothetical protein